MWPFRRKPVISIDDYRRKLGEYGSAIKARYDAAATNRHNQLHWLNADGLAADAANSPEIRRLLRERVRYEVENNSYAKGMTTELVNAVIGRGPRLQFQLPDQRANSIIEAEFASWARKVKLAKKLRIMRRTRATQGEMFIMLTTNPRLDHKVKLDLRLIEPAQVATPDLDSFDERAIDGMRFDEHGNVTEYHVLKAHPGDARNPWKSLDCDVVPAENMVHYFGQDRAGQHRGVPDFVPAASIFAETRRFSSAVIAAAETAAEYSAIMKTDIPAGSEADSVDKGVIMDIEKRSLVFAPAGWEPSQLKAEQPSTKYNEFVDEKMGEAGRSVNMPRTVATGNTNNSSYASSRMDFRSFYTNVRTEQEDIASDVLDSILRAFLLEAVLLSETRLAMPARKALADDAHIWFFEGIEDVDQVKDATARDLNLKNHTTTLALEWARRGYDWETQLRQRAKEIGLMEELGLPMAEAMLTPMAPETDDEEAEVDDE